MYQAAILSTSYDIEDKKFAQIISHLILMTPLIPLDLYLVFDILCLINKRKLENEHKNSRYKDDYFEISHPEIFSNLAHVQYAFLDKTGTLTNNNFPISHIFFNGKIFQFENLEKLYANMKTQHSSAVNTLQVNKNNNSIPSREDIGSFIFDQKNESPSPVLRNEGLEPLIKNKNENSFKLSPRKSITSIGKSSYFKSSKNIFGLQQETSQIKKKAKKTIEENKNDPLTVEEQEIQTKINVSRTNQKYQTLSLMNYKTKELDKSLTYIDFIYDQDDFYNDFNKSRKDKGSLEFQELFECFSLCHFAKSHIVPQTKKIYYESQHKEEEALLEFSTNCNFTFERADNIQNPEEYYILHKNIKYKYQIMGINDFSYQRKVFSLVYRHPFLGKYFLICKGSINAIRLKLNLKPDEEEKFDSIIRQFHNKGLIPIIYSKRELIKEEAELFKRRMKNLKSSLINQSDQLEKLADDIEINLRIICIVGFKNDLKPDALEMVGFFKSMNIDTWILTGDTKENALQAAYSSNLIDISNEAFAISAETKNDLLFSLRNILCEIKNLSFNKIDIKSSTGSIKVQKSIKSGQTYFNKSDKFIFLSGKSLEMIFSDTYLKHNFVFICSIVSTLIAYDLTPSQKALLVNMVQTMFDKNPSVLAVGDGFNDISMLQTADIGVEIINKDSNNQILPSPMAGDIKLSSLRQLKSLMINKALLFADRLYYLFFLLHYKSFIFGAQIFLYNFYDNFSGSVFFDSMFVFLYYNIFLFPNILAMGVFQKAVDSKSIKKCPHLYLQGILIKKRKEIKNNLIKLLIEVFGQTLIVFYLTIYTVGKSFHRDGTPYDKEMMAVMGFYTCLIMNILKFYSDFRFTLRGVALLPFFSLAPLSLIIIFNGVRSSLTNFVPLKPYELQTKDMLDNFNLMMNLILNGLCSYLISFLLRHIWCLIFLPDPFTLINKKEFIQKYRKNHSYILNLFYKSKKFVIFFIL